MSMDDRISAATQLVDSPFLPSTTIQYAWDSVSLTSFLSCKRQYFYRIVQGLQPRNPNIAIALDFGILVHSGLESYAKLRAEGSSHDDAVEATLACISLHPRYANLPIEDDIEEMKAAHDPDEDDGITLRNSRIRTRYHLFRALVWHFEHYRADTMSCLLLPSGSAAAELSFRVELPQVQVFGQSLLLCGHIDRVVEFNSQLLVMDHKTTKSLTSQYFSMFDLSHQMTGYYVGGKTILDRPVSGVVIDGIALQVGGVKFARHLTSRSHGQIREYMATLGDVVAQIELLHGFETMAVENEASWPMNTASCYFCEFKDACRRAPEARQHYINQLFEKRPAWNPLESR